MSALSIVHDDPDNQVCSRCKTDGLHWEMTWCKDARREVRKLHDEDYRVHVCPALPIDDIFQSLG